MSDYYKVLGVKKNSSDKDVKTAFRRLAREHHPDLNPGDETAEREFKKINEAYENKDWTEDETTENYLNEYNLYS